MAEIIMSADILTYLLFIPEEVTRQLHVMAQARESSPVNKTNVLTNVLRH